MQVTMFHFTPHGDDRGQLVAVEAMKDIPFPVKRVYYLYGVGEGIRRGFHAHKSLQQALICVHGSCRIHLDDGTDQAEVLLKDPGEGLYIANNMWREMYDFSPDAVLLVLASEWYDESDYIRDHDAFLKFVGSEASK